MDNGPASGNSGAFSAQQREINLERMQREIFDLVIIGGGITGAGIASEAARWGYKVALVEKGDFASGSSSKSSKLVHGGLRYLANLQFGLIFEACHQRHQLLKFAPHLVRPLPFVLPVYRDGPRPLWQVRMALRLYNTAVTFPGVLSPPTPAGQPAWFRHQIWSASQTLENEPLLNPKELIGAAYYCDYSTDDARLTLSTLLEAHRAGAVLANYVRVVGLLRSKNRVVGVRLCEQRRGLEMEVRARMVISAAGPWTDQIVQGSQHATQPWLRLSKGVHLLIRRERLPTQTAITFNSPGDERFIFLFPWGSHVLVGPTETDYEGEPDRVCATSEDVAYLLEAVERTFPSAGLTEDDVVASYAGLHPLIEYNRAAPPQAGSRYYRIEEITPGLVTVAGGKMTLYRSMAWEVVNQVARYLSRKGDRYPVELRDEPQITFPGETIKNSRVEPAQGHAASGLSEEVDGYLRATYGPDTLAVLRLVREDTTLGERLTPDLPVIKAQVIHAVRQEMALTLGDVLGRRTQVLTQAAGQGLGAMKSVADLMGAELRWSAEEKAAQIAAYREEVSQSQFWREKALSLC